MTSRTTASIAAGFLAGFGATACCFGPLALVSLGFGGAWAARMEKLAPFEPYFIAAAVLFMGFAFHRLYIRPRRCAPGEVCESPAVLRRQRIVFWIVVLAIAGMAAFPLVAPYFY